MRSVEIGQALGSAKPGEKISIETDRGTITVTAGNQIIAGEKIAILGAGTKAIAFSEVLNEANLIEREDYGGQITAVRNQDQEYETAILFLVRSLDEIVRPYLNTYHYIGTELGVVIRSSLFLGDPSSTQLETFDRFGSLDQSRFYRNLETFVDLSAPEEPSNIVPLSSLTDDYNEIIAPHLITRDGFTYWENESNFLGIRDGLAAEPSEVKIADFTRELTGAIAITSESALSPSDNPLARNFNFVTVLESYLTEVTFQYQSGDFELLTVRWKVGDAQVQPTAQRLSINELNGVRTGSTIATPAAIAAETYDLLITYGNHTIRASEAYQFDAEGNLIEESRSVVGISLVTSVTDRFRTLKMLVEGNEPPDALAVDGLVFELVGISANEGGGQTRQFGPTFWATAISYLNNADVIYLDRPGFERLYLQRQNEAPILLTEFPIFENFQSWLINRENGFDVLIRRGFEENENKEAIAYSYDHGSVFSPQTLIQVPAPVAPPQADIATIHSNWLQPLYSFADALETLEAGFNNYPVESDRNLVSAFQFFPFVPLGFSGSLFDPNYNFANVGTFFENVLINLAFNSDQAIEFFSMSDLYDPSPTIDIVNPGGLLDFRGFRLQGRRNHQRLASAFVRGSWTEERFFKTSPSATQNPPQIINYGAAMEETRINLYPINMTIPNTQEGIDLVNVLAVVPYMED